MSGSKGRSVLATIFKNVRNSFQPAKRVSGKFVGEDYFGNKFYEKPAQPELGKRKSERWFEPSGNNSYNFDNEMTAEWESWLRKRRVDPPTEEELRKNLAIAQMKKVNAAELDEKFKSNKEPDQPQVQIPGGDFPKYEIYETIAGKAKKE